MDDGEEREALSGMIVPSMSISILKEATITLISSDDTKGTAVDEDCRRPPTGKRGQGGKKNTHTEIKGN
jgi:hypothetical protein